jgi:hypothetical protein
MKKFKIPLGLFILALICSLALVSCANGNDDTVLSELTGTWIGVSPPLPPSPGFHLKIIIDGSSIAEEYISLNDGLTWDYYATVSGSISGDRLTTKVIEWGTNNQALWAKSAGRDTFEGTMNSSTKITMDNGIVFNKQQ